MILNIARKELKSLFASPMGWIILALLMFGFGTFYLSGMDSYFQVMSGSIRPAERIGVTMFVGQNIYGSAAYLMSFAIPILTMKLISEERKSMTLPFLMSAPISISEIIIGKFLGLLIFLSSLVLYIFLMLTTMNIWADIDFGYLIANSFGLILLISAFVALGTFFSSLTSQPIISAVLSFIALFAMMMAGRYFASDPEHWFNFVSLLPHYQSFSKGIIDSADVAYFVLFTATFIVLTIRRLDSDRLRG
jgi:ABC-2 type transport system permease protein